MGNTKIAKNMLMLFGRTIFNLWISLYISRKLLEILGESDYGILSVVGGIAVLFSFLESAIFSGAQRFQALSINSGVEAYRNCFTTSLNAYASLALVVLVLSETIGVYFVNHILNIPPERLIAANIVFQFSVCSVILTLTNGPYKASIIVYERLDYYAKIGVIVKILQLVIVIGLSFSRWDNLILYAIALFLLSLLRFFIDKIFCIKNIEGCKYKFYFNKRQFVELLSFSGWTIFKSASETVVNQGNNIIVNIYGGTIASASMGLANQIWGATAAVINNIHVAFTSQIIQKWGVKDGFGFFKLIIDSMRYSMYLLILFGIPFVTHTHFFLKLWLVDVPEYASSFSRLSYMSVLLYSIISPLNTGVLAVGIIRKFQIIGSLILVLDLPLALFFLWIKYPLYFVLISRLIFQGILIIYNSKYLSKHTSFPYKEYLQIITLLTLYGGMSVALTYFVNYLFENDNIIGIIISSIMGILTAITLFWFFSLTLSERNRISSFIISKVGL